MYIDDASPQLQLAALGKFKLKKIFKAPKKILRAVVKVPKKILKAAPKAVKKLAPVAALAAGAYFLGPAGVAKLLPALVARRRAAGGGASGPIVDEWGARGPIVDEWGVPRPPAAITAQDALATAAQAYYASRLPSTRPMPSQSSAPYPEADEADYGQPAERGAALGDLKVPLIAAAIAAPLLIAVASGGGGDRR